MPEYTYAVTGIVHPERADVTISKASASFGSDGEFGEFSFSVFKSRIAGILRSKKPLENAKFAAHLIERSVRGITDTLCFTNGCGYDVEIIQLIDLQTGAHYVFGIEDEVVASLNVAGRLSPERVADLHRTKFGRYLQRSFSDLREAVRVPQDSGFFCYRAVECLVHYFMFEHAGEKRKKSDAWVLLRDTLGVAEDEIRDIQSASDPQRRRHRDRAGGAPGPGDPARRRRRVRLQVRRPA